VEAGDVLFASNGEQLSCSGKGGNFWKHRDLLLLPARERFLLPVKG